MMKNFSNLRSFAFFCARLLGAGIGLIFTIFMMVIIVGNVIIHNQLNSILIDETSDVLIVLGYKIEKDPIQPTPILESRLQAAYQYWLRHPEIKIIVSGGRTQNFPQSEAEVMRRSLIEQGIPSERIMMEEHSTRTAHQFVNSQQLMDVKQAMIVTSDFHLPRAVLLAKRAGIMNGTGLAAPTPRDVQSLFVAHIREPLALLNSWLFD